MYMTYRSKNIIQLYTEYIYIPAKHNHYYNFYYILIITELFVGCKH